MSNAALDRTLAVLVLVLAGSGLFTLRIGSPSGGWLFVAHGLLAGALAVAVGLKLRRSVPRAIATRRWGRLALALLVSLFAGAALTGGYLWVASGRIVSIGSWTVLTLHAWSGLILVPLVVAHLIPRRWRLLRPSRRIAAARVRLLSRRAMLMGGLFGLASAGLFGAAALLERVAGVGRRFTGSRWLPSGGIPPPTTFFGEPVPPLDLASWRLCVRGRVTRPASYSLAGLRSLGEADLTAVLDCTSGWAMETGWRGIPLSVVLAAAGPAPDAGRVEVRSVTGWGAGLDFVEAGRCILATGVAGGPLPLENGAPCRLVVPDRRGLDWVKWVTDVEVR